jgi:hypothetical protein
VVGSTTLPPKLVGPTYYHTKYIGRLLVSTLLAGRQNALELLGLEAAWGGK